MSLFPDRFSHSAWTAAESAHSNCVGSRMYACLCVTCHRHFWQDDQGLLCATAVTKGVEWTLNKSRRTKLTLEKNVIFFCKQMAIECVILSRENKVKSNSGANDTTTLLSKCWGLTQSTHIGVCHHGNVDRQCFDSVCETC